MPPTKSEGCKMICSTRASKLCQTKKIFFHFYAQILAKRFDRFFEFSNFSISTIFDDDLLPLNRVSRKKSHSTTFSSKRWRFRTSHFFDFQTFVTQLFEWSVGWISIFLKNDNIENLRKYFWALTKKPRLCFRDQFPVPCTAINL